MSNTNLTVDQFLLDVRHEIDSLKENATPKELSNLNFDQFNYNHKDNCIYGQLTGNCESERAKILMDNSCVRVLDLKNQRNKNNGSFGSAYINREGLSAKSLIDSGYVNGKYSGQTWEDLTYNHPSNTRYLYLSALEGYISTVGANNKGIITYLKGETKDLEL